MSSRRAARLYLILLLSALVTVGAQATSYRGAVIPNHVHYALTLAHATYGVPYRELRSVAWCESRWTRGAPIDKFASADAANLFQITPAAWERTPYRHFSPLDVIANALAAAWLVKQDGGWQEWACKP